MQIYTARFADVEDCEGLTTISLAKHPPEWYTGLEYPNLFSTERLIKMYNKGEITSFQYTEHFVQEILRKLNPETVLRDIIGMSKGGDVYLCCWGNPDEFCHRHIVLNWLNSWLKQNPGAFDIPLISEVVWKKKCEHHDKP